ncbi:MAG: hypothetical protein FJ295_09305 [Planctomycetes bacterium]|nr:hypothetical protein [Planctomycetota bacterium]
MPDPSRPFLQWYSESEAEGELAAVYDEWRQRNPGRRLIPDILKCFGQRPDFLRCVIDFSDRVHFRDGHLTRRIKEMLATFVSGLNRCPY